MGDFFHGWRRKAGCVALVMACVLTTSLWIRSFTVREELLSFDLGNRRITFFSNNGGMSIWDVRKVDWLNERDWVATEILAAEPTHSYGLIGILLAVPGLMMIFWEALTKEIRLWPQRKRST